MQLQENDGIIWLVCPLWMKASTSEHAGCVSKTTRYLLGHHMSPSALSYIGGAYSERDTSLFPGQFQECYVIKTGFSSLHHSCFFATSVNREDYTKRANESGSP